MQAIKTFFADPVNQVAVFVFLLLCFFMPSVYLPYDKDSFVPWCLYIFNNGIAQAYHVPAPPMNYPPLICYMMWLFGKLQGSAGNIQNYFHFFKWYGLLFDFLGALLVLRFVKDNKHRILFILLMIANPAFIYNSYMWGQLDSILVFFILACVWYLLQKRPIVAAIMFLLAINMKPQAIIFVPPLFLLAVVNLKGEIKWKTAFQTIAACIALELVLLTPFILAGEVMSVANAYLHAVDFHPKISIAAFNIWVLLVGKDNLGLSDSLQWGLLTYKQAGLLMFFIASFFAMLPLFLAALYAVFKRPRFIINNQIVLLTFALIPLLFFYLNTQMHERYSHPAMVFIAAYSFLTRRPYLFLLFCFTYFCNLEPRLYAMGFPNYNILIFDPLFVAILFATIIASLFYLLYKEVYLQKNTYDR